MSADKIRVWMACYHSQLSLDRFYESRVILAVKMPIWMDVQLIPALIGFVQRPEKMPPGLMSGSARGFSAHPLFPRPGPGVGHPLRSTYHAYRGKPGPGILKTFNP